MNPNIENLLQAEIDGISTPEQHDELNNLLASDQGVREAYDELQAVKSAFDSFHVREPSPQLRSNILSALPPTTQTQQKAASFSIGNWIRSLLVSPRPIALAYAFSIGAILTIGVFSILDSGFSGPPAENIMGTIHGQQLEISDQEPVLEGASRIDFSSAGVDGSVRIGESDEIEAVQIAFEAMTSVEVRIGYDKTVLRPTVVNNLSPMEDVLTSSTAGQISILATGVIDQVIRFRKLQPDAARPSVEIFSDGEKIFTL